MLSPGRLKPGIAYGLVLGVLAILKLLGLQALSLQRGSQVDFLVVSGSGGLSIAAGVLPSRASGSLLSAGIAGGILGVCSFLTIVFYSLLNPHIVSTGNASIWLLFLAVFGVPPFISVLFGVVGRYLHKRSRVS
jgi:hypothetical protein